MNSIGASLRIPKNAVPAWLALEAAHDRLLRTPVCTQAPDDWSSDAKPAVRRDAAVACTFCPLLEPCRAYADLAGERHGVWGGIDRTTRPLGRQEAAA